MSLQDRLCADTEDRARLHRGLRWGLALPCWFLLGVLGLASVRWLDALVRWAVAR